jgi:signal transduction histidine kinase
MRFRTVFGACFLLLVMGGSALCEPKRILLLHSFGRDFAPWNQYARSIREELGRQSHEPVDIFEASLATARFNNDEEGPFVDYLRALFVKRQLDLVIAIGGPATDFFQRHRQHLFPSIPIVYTGVEERRVPYNILTTNDAVVANKNDFTRSIESILEVLPETSNVVVIMGNSPIERYWTEQLRIAFRPFEGRLKFDWLDGQSFKDMLVHTAALPQRSAIFFGLMLVDGDGVAHEEQKALIRLRETANAPIFSYTDAFFGLGIVGGRLNTIADLGPQAVSAAIRIMDGEIPSGIKTPPVEYGAPKYDWRELQRWHISESQLPPGSKIDFRVPSVWEQYRPQITAGLATMLLQAAIITWLLIERRRRRLAESEATNRRREVIRLNRVSTANVLSSSIAHELNQPLGAILSNTEAAQMLLKADPPDIAQINEILSDIVRDEQRAGDIIHGLRNLLNNRVKTDLRPSDMNDTVRDVVRIVSPEIASRGVVLRTVLAPEALLVRSDPIHLQQVIINLVVNGMDAMEDEPKPHHLTIRTRQNAESGAVEVRISDSGKGIPEDNITSIFDAFVTTKPKGTGLGLPIARTIVESYGGDIWAENRQRGAVFCFRLPLAQASAA